jgi:hypothetical protein
MACGLKKNEKYIPAHLEKQFGNYFPNHYVWITDHLSTFDQPIPFRGYQGFFNVPDEILVPQSFPFRG